jgi:hypothetical protein
VAKIINTAGMTPFRVVLDPTPAALTRFVWALAKTGAKVSSSPVGARMGEPLTFLVWLKPMSFQMFRAWCRPVEFQFIAAEAIGLDGSVKA